MCGIVGYIGNESVGNILLDGLQTLEYRGYDSAGVAMVVNGNVELTKSIGRIANLKEIVKGEANLGIGHTRWATHGGVTELNCHPHQSKTKRFTLVHNGVIENEQLLRREFFSDYNFYGQTDSEVIVNLLELYVSQGSTILDAISKLIEALHGSYALGIIDNEDTNTLYAVKNKSPLLVGKGKGFNMIGSDAMAMMKKTNEFIELNDKEVIKLTKESIELFDAKLNKINRKSYSIKLDEFDFEKGSYDHFMLKEIDEQASVIRRTLSAYVNNGEILIDNEVLNKFKECDKIYVLAAGTSYHSGLIGKQVFEQIAGIPTEVCIASEFVYNQPLLSKKPLFLVISQSGETADCRAALKNVKGLGSVITITNVKGSTLSREADHTLLVSAGPEIAVASTKAYTAQYLLQLLLGYKLGNAKFDIIKELNKAANIIEKMCNNKEQIKKVVQNNLLESRNAFYIGRHVDYYVSVEAALKLKEVSYIQCEGFAGGELKHGTLALIEQDTPVIAIISQEKIALNTRSNLKETVARGAKPIVISLKSMSEETDQIIIDDVHQSITPLVTVVPTQLIAYYTAVLKNLDVDKPRNLAKSVTVE